MRLPLFVRLCATAIIVLTANPVSGAEFPLLEGPATYMGEHREEKETRGVLLFLGENSWFALRERVVLPNGKISSWETTGKWHQIRDGELVQLTNRQGFYRILNVGGAGDIYQGAQLAGGKPIVLILRPTGGEPPEYEISGLLRVSGTEISLEDEDSGIVHPVLPGDAVAAFLRDRDLASARDGFPVQVMAAISRNGRQPALRVSEIRAIPAKKPPPYDAVGYFQDAVAGSHWKLVRLGPGDPPPCVVSFRQDQGKKDGTMELFDGIRRIAGKYALRDDGIAFTVAVKDARLMALFRQARSWELVGDVLELRGEKGLLALLEKIR